MTQVVVKGNLTEDPKVKYTASGRAVANFTVASTPRVKDGDQWKDGEPAFYRVAIWGASAEHFAESAGKGTRVIVEGTLTPREYESNGVKRLSLDVTAEEVGISTKFKAIGGAVAQSPYNDGYGNSGDPWSSPATDEPPF